MKKILIGMLALCQLSCTKDVGSSFADKDAVYFEYSFKRIQTIINFDNIVYSFGMKEDNVKIDTAKIVVKLMGKTSEHERYYSVRVSQDSTTAVEGVHYETIPTLHKFGPNKLQDTLRIVLKRDALSSSHITKEEKTLKLEIVPSDDFNTGVDKGRFMKLRINNYLSEPGWWPRYEFFGIYYYHPEKWKILMKFHDDFKKTGTEAPVNHSQVAPYFNALRTYLVNIPTYDKETGQRVLMSAMVD